ncbi:MAG TPA: ATP-binding cassette domain-containing protein [Gemmataceae bacterium]
MTAVIETHGLTKSFGGTAGVHRLDLAVPAGAVFALLGGNGAGKSTTIKLLTGLLPPDAGRATILGKDCWADAIELRHQVGYVPERPKFYDWMTVDEVGWFTAGFHAAGFLPRFRDWRDRFRLRGAAKLKSLSKGEYAKVGLALALAPDPQVLILDEPTSGLDLRIRREFLESMVALAAEGRTVLISSHQVAEVERVASHVAFLAHGRPLLTATMDDLRRRLVRYRLRYEGEPPDAARLGTVLHRNGAGRLWQAVIQDPVAEAVEALRSASGVAEFEAMPLTLEEAYSALVAREETP